MNDKMFKLLILFGLEYIEWMERDQSVDLCSFLSNNNIKLETDDREYKWEILNKITDTK